MNFKAKLRRYRRWLLVLMLLAVVGIVSGCQTIGFYAQAIKGQYQIFAHQRPIDKLIADPKTDPALKTQLELLEQLRLYADKELKLPVNGHYRKYTDVHRRYVVWNVQAASRFSLEPKMWWYPLVGSLEYRGYFSESGARDYAQRLLAKDYDVCVEGVEAYSTLGWFKDPVLNTFIYRDEAELAEVIFHELAHQRVFARGDTDFNEAFATTVGQESARRWLRARGDTNRYQAYVASLRRNDQFVHLIMKARERLEKVYGDERDKEGKIKRAKQPPAPGAQLEQEKQQAFDQLRRDYEQLKAEWGGYAGYDDWFATDLNNAKLNTVANYFDFVPGFERLLSLNDGDLEEFYHETERLAKMPQEERHEWLRDLPKAK